MGQEGGLGLEGRGWGWGWDQGGGKMDCEKESYVKKGDEWKGRKGERGGRGKGLMEGREDGVGKGKG